MKKLIRSYFLFFSWSPVGFNFIIAFLTSFIILFIYGENVSGKHFLIPLAVIIVHTVLICLIINKYITRPKNILWSTDSELCRILVLGDDHKVVVEKPIWAKGKVYVIKDPRGYYRKELVVQTSVEGKYRYSRITIPVKLTLKLNSGYDKLEVFEALIKNQGDKECPVDYWIGERCLSIEEYVTSVFQKINKGNQWRINQVISEYAQFQMSTPALLDKIIEVLIFPEKLFSNVVDAQICLEDPLSSSCKGMSCGSDNN